MSLLDRPARSVDRLPGDGWRYGARADLEAVRFGTASTRLRFYAARTSAPEGLCVLATTRPGGASRGAACNETAVLRRVGVLAFEGARTGDPATFAVGFLVPDGIERILVAGQVLVVKNNMAATTVPFDLTPTVTLVGPAAEQVRPDGGEDWLRGQIDGLPSVEVPLSHASSTVDRPTPLTTLRLVTPAAAPAGSVIQLRIAGESGLLDRDTVFGIDATLERFEGGRWRAAYQLNFPLSDSRYPPPASPVKPGGNARLSIGFSGSAPLPVRLPDVVPGRYRISKEVSSTGSGTTETRTLTTELEVTPDPVVPPASSDALIERSQARLLAIGPDGTRVWTAPARPSARPPGADGDLVCWVFSGPGRGGVDCSGTGELARRGGFIATQHDFETGSRWGYVVAAPGATAVRVDGEQIPLTNAVAFLNSLRRDRPTVEVTFPDGVKTFR